MTGQAKRNIMVNKGKEVISKTHKGQQVYQTYSKGSTEKHPEDGGIGSSLYLITHTFQSKSSFCKLELLPTFCLLLLLVPLHLHQIELLTVHAMAGELLKSNDLLINRKCTIPLTF